MEPQNHYILQRGHTERKLEMQNIYNERADDRNRKWRFHKGNKNMQWQQISQCNKKKKNKEEKRHLSLETKEWEAGVDEWRRWIKVGWRWKVRQVTMGKFYESHSLIIGHFEGVLKKISLLPRAGPCLGYVCNMWVTLFLCSQISQGDPKTISWHNITFNLHHSSSDIFHGEVKWNVCLPA